MQKENIMIFSSNSGEYFAKLIAARLGVPMVNIERKSFNDGEKYYRLDMETVSTLEGNGINDMQHDLQDACVIYVAPLVTDTDLLELYRIGCTLSMNGTRKRYFVVPFLGYSTMERCVIPGECVTAKENVRMLSAIPNSASGNIFMLLDLHVSGLLHYFEGPCIRLEMYAEAVLIEGIKKLGLPSKIVDGAETAFMFGSADLGRPKWVATFASIFHTELALISKTRRMDQTQVQAVIGDVADRCIVIYDDMTRSGGTLMHAATAYLQRGATRVFAVLSHFALCNEDVIDQLLASDIERIVTTNSHPMSQHPKVTANPDRFIVMDVSGVFADRVRIGMQK